MKTITTGIRDSAVLHGIVLGSWAAFRLTGLMSGRFRRAVERFDAVYRFRVGDAARCLVFDQGRIRVRSGSSALIPDYELVLIDPAGVLQSMRKDPNDTLKLLLENKIDQKGNNYYLFKYGYLWGLCIRLLQDFHQRFAALRPSKTGSAAAGAS